MELTEWRVADSSPGLVDGPDSLDSAELEWIPFTAPGTVAVALDGAGRWSESTPTDLDAPDWWFRCEFDSPGSGGPWNLELGGLATLADVWLNGTHVLTSRNMFRSHLVPLSELRAEGNQLVVRCASLREAMAPRRPRPRWKTNLVEHQNLRWFRTTLHGRRAGWADLGAPVGPWRPVRLRPAVAVEPTDVELRVQLVDDTGRVEVDVAARRAVTSMELVVGDQRASLTSSGVDAEVWSGGVEVPDVERWWPSGHGDQPRYAAHLEVTSEAGTERVELPAVGFRTVSFGDPDSPELSINGEAVFCRGVCWVPADPVGLVASPDEVRAMLESLRDAGFNLVRINGTAVYEDAVFFDLCDELGLMVWQDLMFARMDYPCDDPEFLGEARAETREALGALQGRPSPVVVCGGTEIGQQAAMLGRPADPETLIGAALVGEVAGTLPGTPYLIDAPIGGTHPFTVDRGVAFYFGVGGYRRPLSDARSAAPRFVAECLAFSSVPDDAVVEEMRRGGMTVGDAAWKRAVPRDPGTSWDFEDVRDHYVEQLFGLDPADVRSFDPDRYLDLGRAAVARVMEVTLSEWRRPASPTQGAVILEARDQRVGAGPGVLDVHGHPKSVLHAARRALSPTALLLSDEGLNGLEIWAVHDGPLPVAGELRVTAFAGRHLVAEGKVPCHVEPRSHTWFNAEAVLGQFMDVTAAFRFGSAPLTAVAVHWRVGEELVARAVHHPWTAPLVRSEIGLTATARPLDEGRFELEVATVELAQCVTIEGRDLLVSDNGFDIEPGGRVLVSATSPGPLRARVRALNGMDGVPIIEDARRDA